MNKSHLKIVKQGIPIEFKILRKLDNVKINPLYNC